MERETAVALLEEALWRIKHPSRNGHGGPMQSGGAYWRLAKVLREFLEPRLKSDGGEEDAERILKIHGRIVGAQ